MLRNMLMQNRFSQSETTVTSEFPMTYAISA